MINYRSIVIASVVLAVGVAVWLSKPSSQRPASGELMAVVSVPELSAQEQRGRAAFNRLLKKSVAHLVLA